MKFQGFHRRHYECSTDPSSTKVGHHGHRHDVSLSDHTESSEVGEAKLESAHYVADHIVVAFCDDECFGAALVDFHEEVGAVVFRKTDPVHLNYCREIISPKESQQIGCLQA